MARATGTGEASVGGTSSVRRGKYQECHVFGHWACECHVRDILEQRGGDGVRACVNVPEQVAAGYQLVVVPCVSCVSDHVSVSRTVQAQ